MSELLKPRKHRELLVSKKHRAGLARRTRVRGWKDAADPTSQRASGSAGAWAKMKDRARIQTEIVANCASWRRG